MSAHESMPASAAPAAVRIRRCRLPAAIALPLCVGAWVLSIGPVSAGLPTAGAAAPDMGMAPSDTLGAGSVEWAYDRWSVPWVQVQGPYDALMPHSYATLQVLACASADLERERLVRHLTREECEHRMAAFRADQDTALIFLVHLRTFRVPGADALLHLDSTVRLSLEDDGGRRWAPQSVERGPVVPTEAGLSLRRVYDPPWIRPQGLGTRRNEVVQGKSVNVVEHRVRFSRRDPPKGDPVLRRDLRWLRLRISAGSEEWVATWSFRSGGAGSL